MSGLDDETTYRDLHAFARAVYYAAANYEPSLDDDYQRNPLSAGEPRSFCRPTRLTRPRLRAGQRRVRGLNRGRW